MRLLRQKVFSSPLEKLLYLERMFAAWEYEGLSKAEADALRAEKHELAKKIWENRRNAEKRIDLAQQRQAKSVKNMLVADKFDKSSLGKSLQDPELVKKVMENKPEGTEFININKKGNAFATTAKNVKPDWVQKKSRDRAMRRLEEAKYAVGMGDLHDAQTIGHELEHIKNGDILPGVEDKLSQEINANRGSVARIKEAGGSGRQQFAAKIRGEFSNRSYKQAESIKYNLNAARDLYNENENLLTDFRERQTKSRLDKYNSKIRELEDKVSAGQIAKYDYNMNKFNTKFKKYDIRLDKEAASYDRRLANNKYLDPLTRAENQVSADVYEQSAVKKYQNLDDLKKSKKDISKALKEGSKAEKELQKLREKGVPKTIQRRSEHILNLDNRVIDQFTNIKDGSKAAKIIDKPYLKELAQNASKTTKKNIMNSMSRKNLYSILGGHHLL